MRQSLLWLTVGAGLIFHGRGHAAKAGLTAQQNDRPNVVFILADDLGYGDLSGYGATDMRTSNVDSLIADGMKFTRAYANCPVCSPTRAALMTGRYPEQVGVPGVIRTHAHDNWGYLAQDAILLPQMLAKAGYHTAHVGKWHLGLREENHPLRRGFDHFHGFLGDMMDDYYHHLRHNINYLRLGFDEIESEGHATDLFTDWAVGYIDQRAAEDEPFFLYLAYNAPHSPIQPPREWLENVRRREEGIADKRAKLVALIEHLDDGVGRVIATLKKHDLYDNTIIVFTSDNGGALWAGAGNGPLRAAKGQLYEGGIRVPQVVVWPGRIKPGSVTARDMLSMDWFPTLCEIAGVEVEHEIDGASMLPTLLGRSQPGEGRDLFWTRREGGDRFMGMAAWAARRGPWKLVHGSPTEPFELFNLVEDPKEEHNLREAEKQVFRDLARRLRAHIQRSARIPWLPPRDMVTH
ncbi:MAG: sulfatase-like hydrolase/transferase [Phycisphaerales bacterium]|nr:MAG: sulfatase-like hydrolase/transferase [Phycisphaerales bacterium]